MTMYFFYIWKSNTGTNLPVWSPNIVALLYRLIIFLILVSFFSVLPNNSFAKSKENKKACEAWCGNNKPLCEYCNRNVFCGHHNYILKSFKKGTGNWYACGNQNKQSCTAWCESDEGISEGCTKCSTKSNCGSGFHDIKRYEQKGKFWSWSACARNKKSINQYWPGNNLARQEHRILLVSVGGVGELIGEHDGFAWFCEKYFPNDPSVLCISSWALPTTVSYTLSNNIAELAKEIEERSGVTPKIVLVGKSMGGCKLHHAVAGTGTGAFGKLKDMDVNLFVGIDMSCSLERHFPTDPLFFERNVEKLLAFYQDKDRGKRSQTGHPGIYSGEELDYSININVNQDSFDIEAEEMSPYGAPICTNVGHKEIDDCDYLKQIVRELVLKRLTKNWIPPTADCKDLRAYKKDALAGLNWCKSWLREGDGTPYSPICDNSRTRFRTCAELGKSICPHGSFDDIDFNTLSTCRTPVDIVSSTQWKSMSFDPVIPSEGVCSPDLINEWTQLDYDDSEWRNACIAGPHEEGINPDIGTTMIWDCPNGEPSYDGKTGPLVAYFRHTFTIDKEIESAFVQLVVDDNFQLYINGDLVNEYTSGHSGPSSLVHDPIDIKPYLQTGNNILAVRAWDGGYSDCQVTDRLYEAFTITGQVLYLE